MKVGKENKGGNTEFAFLAAIGKAKNTKKTTSEIMQNHLNTKINH